MAKPKHGRCNSPISLHDHPHAPPYRFPSPAILSALAVIATAQPVAGGPLPTPPPTFLCPFIERDTSPGSSASTPTLSPTPTPSPSQCGVVADRYVQDSDNSWQKAETWSLYGSTVSVIPTSHPSLRSQHVFSQCSGSSTASTSAVQPPPSSSPSPIPTSTPSTVVFDTSVLPAGWNSGSTLSSTASTTILALAIVLAGSICVFIIGCLIWRRRKKRTRDIERKLGHKGGTHDDSQDNRREKDARGKMRMWAKASARWKSNIRQSARRRRKRPMVSSIDNRPLSPTISDSPQLSVVAPSTPSRRGSIASEEPDSPRPEAVSCLNDIVTEPPDPPRSASPPTYGASFVPPFSRLPPSSAVSDPSSTPPHSTQRGNPPSFIEDEPLPYIPRSDGHVATDDKSQLAHIRELASSPPTIVDADASTMQPVSAPELHEVENNLDDLDIDPSEVPAPFHDFGLLPSPPSKADLPSPFDYLGDHPLRYGEDGILVSLPVPESLGPSLGASPSAPPIDDPGLEPSAPSFEGEDELFQDWDGASSHVPEATSADLDSTFARTIESSISSTISSASRASFSSIGESAARDGTLPRYHP